VLGDDVGSRWGGSKRWQIGGIEGQGDLRVCERGMGNRITYSISDRNVVTEGDGTKDLYSPTKRVDTNR
jgi:hypothetical protein